MRLHQLRIQAFGPFATQQQIDFDALADHGIHLIHGPTGAGKTSILDAICFALFASLPGARKGRRDSVRSDHAAPGTRPEVELEFSVGDRRLRLLRWPEHEVAKKRGTGTRAQRAGVLLQERSAGSWQTISTRNDEVAQVIDDLLGMGLEQFASVVLLPQGEFAAFLRAKPDERGKVLERLFDIRGFRQIEQWLSEHRNTLRLTVADLDAERDRLTARADEALLTLEPQILGELLTECGAPTETDDTDDADETEKRCVADELSSDAGPALLDLLVQGLSRRTTEALADAEQIEARRHDAQERLDEQRALQSEQAKAADARSALRGLDERAAQLAAAGTAVADHERAAACLPIIEEAHRRRAVQARTTTDVDRARDALQQVLPWPLPDDDGGFSGDADGRGDAASTGDAGDQDPLADVRTRLAAGSTVLTGRRELRHHARLADHALAEARARLRAASAAADAATQRLADTQQELAEQITAQQQHDAGAAELETWQHHTRTLHALVDALEIVEQASSHTAEKHDALTVAQARWQRAERKVLDLRSRRLSGMAAELAGGLQDEMACPVCGSTGHPAPAQPAPDAVSAEALDAAERAATSALASRQELVAASADAQARYDSALDAAHARAAEIAPDVLTVGQEHLLTPGFGDTLTTATQSAADRVRVAQRHRAASEQLAARITAAQDQLAQLTAAADATAAELVAQRARTEVAEQAQADATRAETDLLTRHAVECGCSGSAGHVQTVGADSDAAPVDGDAATDPAQWHSRCVDLLAALDRTLADAAVADREAHTASRAMRTALTDAGFEDAIAAEQHALPADRRAALRSMLDTARTARSRAMGVLELPQVAAAEAQPPAQVEPAVAALHEVAGLSRAAEGVAESLDRVRRALTRIGSDLRTCRDRALPVREELATAESVAAAVTGGGDNALRMRLTSYVLAARLEGVTALANERLTDMTDGRFSLEHTDALAAHGSKSGLGLQVRDAWTGQTRDTATLSGGESFMASLALALGLGEAVLQAAGGRRLQTLLVDEGFGGLDEDSLEAVMDVLDRLRSGGRTVGVVSHVAELRTRIPAQIVVRKTSAGSSVQVRTPDVA